MPITTRTPIPPGTASRRTAGQAPPLRRPAALAPRLARTFLLSISLAAVLAGCSAGSATTGSPAGSAAGSSASAIAAASTPAAQASQALKPPTATPLASAPAQPAGDGTTATIETALGSISIELYTKSAPVASQNFINLAEAGFYDGVVFHRIYPGFMIQGGDPMGTGAGGPGYVFPDEPFAGDYTRGMVAMANGGPNTNGSQFFILVADYPLQRQYTIFGHVVSGMDVVDQIVSGPRGGPEDDQALDPVKMQKVTIQKP